MPKKLPDLSEDDLESDPEILSDPAHEPASPQPEPGNAIAPANQSTRPSSYIKPEDDHIVDYIGGKPVYVSECTEFGVIFMGLMSLMSRAMGLDDGPTPEGKTPNYLRVTCPHCGQKTVTLAPHIERFCAGCGSQLPRPDSYSPHPHIRPIGDEIIEAEIIDPDNGGQ